MFRKSGSESRLAKLGEFFVRRPPDVDALVRAGDHDGLVDAARFRDLVPTGEGQFADLAVPVREAALRALGYVETVEAGVLAEGLEDPFDAVRVAAVEGLRQRAEVETLCTAVGAWTGLNASRARGAAIDALFGLRAEGSTMLLTSALLRAPGEDPLADGDAALIRAMLEKEAHERAWPEVTALLIGTLSASSAVVRQRAQTLLVTLAPVSVDALVNELREGPAPAAAAAVLGTIKDQRAIEPLLAALDRPDPVTRGAACAALGELRDPAAVEPLMRATRDREHAVRAAAGSALDALGTVAVAFATAALLRPQKDKRTLVEEELWLPNGSYERPTARAGRLDPHHRIIGVGGNGSGVRSN